MATVGELMRHIVRFVRGMFSAFARAGIAMPFFGTARAN